MHPAAALPVVIGHRGALLASPENTMAGFRLARRLGAGGVELDVHQSRDGALVVHHDYSLDRTTSGSGPVFGHDWASLAQLDVGSWFSEDFSDERMPLLAEVLELDGLEFEVELKGYGEGVIDEVLRVVDEAGALDRVEFTSGNVSLLAELRRRREEATTGLFVPRREHWMDDEIHEHWVLGHARFSTSQVIHVRAGEVTSSIVEQLHALGRTVMANDAQSAGDVARAADAGADRLSANDVVMAVEALGRR